MLFKEQYAPGWKVDVNGRPAAVYPAGPGMMWIPLDGRDGPVTVALHFRLSIVDKLGYAGSIASLVGLVVLLFSGGLRRPFRRGVRTIVHGPMVSVPEQRTAPVGVGLVK